MEPERIADMIIKAFKHDVIVEIRDTDAEPLIMEEKKATLPFRMTVKFPNNYGASIIRNNFSYGSGLEVEIGVIKYEGCNYDLTYKTPITNDVLGYVPEDEIIGILK